MTTGKIGFACKWIDRPDQVNGIRPGDACRRFNTGTTTISWLNRQSRDVAVERLWQLMTRNIESAYELVKQVGELDGNLRMVRLSSDILPAYTEPSWDWFWRMPDVKNYCQVHFGRVGELARNRSVRLSFHPGQFTVLASDRPDVVERSIAEFEYHADMARYMGYGRSFQDFKINVHISGRRGPAGIKEVLGRLSPEARNTITIENDEISWGIDASLELVDHCALVLDLHHHWIHSNGEYIEVQDPRVSRIVDSWRGTRPVIHYSVSREDLLVDHSRTSLPDFKQLVVEQGYRRAHLRAHSDFFWNQAANQWALSFSDVADIMCESKGKNLASFSLYNQRNQHG